MRAAVFCPKENIGLVVRVHTSSHSVKFEKSGFQKVQIQVISESSISCLIMSIKKIL